MFSPYYAWARRRAANSRADANNHCALNVALYGKGAKRWAMTERGRDSVRRDARTLEIGPGAMRWHDDGSLTVDIDEVTVPWPSRIRGRVVLRPALRFDHSVALAQGHRWCAIAPRAQVEVEFDRPGLSWSGTGYLDCNHGDAPLEQTFSRWQWSRAHLSGDRSMVLYDIERRDDEPLSIGLLFEADGSVREIEPPSHAALPNTLWRVPRSSRCDAGARSQVIQTLTDAPFYARSLVHTHWLGEPVVAMHESLSLQRFDTRWVQVMLPFRMPRALR